jgi:tetratricopeptide (TPR) repeat protein
MTSSGIAEQSAIHRIEQIAESCEAGEFEAVDLLDTGALAIAGAPRLVRIRVIPALRAANEPARLARVLQLWLETGSGKTADWLQLAATQRKLAREDEARALLERLVNEFPDDPAVCAAAIQQALQQGRVTDASRISEGFSGWREVPARAAVLGMTAFLRDGKPQRAIDLGKAFPEEANGAVLGATADAFLALDNPVVAARYAQRALAAGHDTANVRLLLARTASARFEHDRAIVHLSAALEASPFNVRVLASLGELMLMRRRPKAAKIYLERAVGLAPELVNIRVHLARAHKELRDYEAAAVEFAEVLRREPGNLQHRRQAAAVFGQANRPHEGATLLQEVINERRKALPASLEAGLEQLWENTETATIPPARLEWAWSLRSAVSDLPRDEWERRARWGWLADRLLQEWLETSPDRAEEAMLRLANLGHVSQALERVARSEGGLILASAHVGPLFAGPLALQLLDLPCKWLASTPSIEGMAYSDTLISTSDQSEGKVVRASIAALDAQTSIALAVDGAMTMAAPRVPFEGQEVTYSSFAARLAHRKKSRSYFVAPFWQDNRLAFDLLELPRAAPDEELAPFLDRWRAAWFENLRRLLAGDPENLRLSGGIWRHVRPISGHAG